jgi:hypothetical protein
MKANFTSTHGIDRGAAERAAIERWEGEGGRAPEIEEPRATRSITLSGNGDCVQRDATRAASPR